MNIEHRTLFVASMFALMGFYALLRPRDVPRFFGTEASTPSARNEVRAVYGGFGVALAAVLAWSVLTAAGLGLSSGVQLAAAVALFGMAGGRGISMLVERPGGWPLAFGALELTGGALLIV